VSARKEREDAAPLLDFPLGDERGDAFSLPLPTEGPSVEPAALRPAPLLPRAGAAAADAALVALIVLIAMLAAAAARDHWPAPRGLLWAAAFGLYLSFFATVLPLVLFGRTVGMALGDLVAAPAGGTRRLSLREAVLRWTGSVLTLASLGGSLLFTRRDPAAPTLADGLSGRAILRAEPPSEAS
jgi:RDD family